jgi:pyruvate kinase
MPPENSDSAKVLIGTNSMRRAKIVCTIGPSCNTEALLRDLMRLGMDVARLNFSHGTHEEHAKVIERLRKVAMAEHRTICILQDLQGPKIRTGRLRDRRPVMLATGSRLTITPRNILGTSTLISTSFKVLAEEVQPGARILLSDGLIELRVTAIHGDDVECEVVNGGELREHQGINLPGLALRVPALTEKDRKDLEFGITHGVDMVALSFVRTANDVLEARKLIGNRSDDLPVIAKLEKPQAIEHLDEILEVADGVMVARGDLGVELPPEQVPIIQKHIIRRASESRKPVITATQMLESMIEHPRPTRAEASDVANAIFDGTDAVMLSGETASGKYPRETVTMMGRIIVEAESHMHDIGQVRRRREHQHLTISETICESVAHAAEELNMHAIAVYTESGTTARLVSKYRAKSPVYAFAHRDSVCNRLNLYWGVHPTGCERVRSVEEMLRHAERTLMDKGLLAAGQIMAIISGTRGASGSTNLMRLHVAGESDRSERRSAGKNKG